MEEKAHTSTLSGRREGYKLLLIDDDDFLIDMYSRKFSEEGDAVRTCLSVPEALDILRGGFTPDAIAFDLIMPQHNGFDFLHALREEKLGGSAVLIALTNQWEDENRVKAESFGVDAYIIKAETIPSEVVTKIHEVISNKRPAQA